MTSQRRINKHFRVHLKIFSVISPLLCFAQGLKIFDSPVDIKFDSGDRTREYKRMKIYNLHVREEEEGQYVET